MSCMRGLVLAAAVMLAACAIPSPPVAKSSIGASPTPETTPSSQATPSPGLTCRLPVTWAVVNGNTATGKAGFLRFSDQILSEDPTAPAGSRFFDRAYSRWLAVGRDAVSADGSRYAYTEGNAFLNTPGRLHVVDVASGTDRVIYSGPTVYSVVDFAPEGIYLTRAAPEGPSVGLWLQDPAGGTARLINSTIQVPAIGGAAAWGQDFNSGDPNPPPGGIAGPRNRIERVDLNTGTLTPWFYRSGAYVSVAGFDAKSNPFISVDRPSPNDPNANHDTIELWLVTTPTTAQRLFAGELSTSWPAGLAAIDNHGIWFDGGAGSIPNPNGSGGWISSGIATIWLYAQGAIGKVAELNADSLSVAGGCLASS